MDAGQGINDAQGSSSYRKREGLGSSSFLHRLCGSLLPPPNGRSCAQPSFPWSFPRELQNSRCQPLSPIVKAALTLTLWEGRVIIVAWGLFLEQTSTKYPAEHSGLSTCLSRDNKKNGGSCLLLLTLVLSLQWSHLCATVAFLTDPASDRWQPQRDPPYWQWCGSVPGT